MRVLDEFQSVRMLIAKIVQPFKIELAVAAEKHNAWKHCRNQVAVVHEPALGLSYHVALLKDKPDKAVSFPVEEAEKLKNREG